MIDGTTNGLRKDDVKGSHFKLTVTLITEGVVLIILLKT
jgi:hypothetical protein